MAQGSSAAGKQLRRKFRHAVAFCGLAAAGAALAQAAGAADKPTHGPVDIQVIESGKPLPPAPWKCNPKPDAFTICVSEDPITLTGEPPARSIPWQIKTKGWSFVPVTGLTFDKGAWSLHPASSTNWVARGQKDGTDTKYTINVTNGKTTVPWDPRIINN
jgi:hypothetical protein